jgi:hypothetical protein
MSNLNTIGKNGITEGATGKKYHTIQGFRAGLEKSCGMWFIHSGHDSVMKSCAASLASPGK